MNISQAIEIIKTFREFNSNIFTGSKQIDKIQDEFKPFPKNIVEYLNLTIPSENIYIDLTGDPFCLFSAEELIPRKNEFAYEFELESGSWINNWVIFGLQGNDPFCFGLSNDFPKIYRFYYNGVSGLGEPIPIADSIGQFLVCAFAIDHAINNFKDSIIGENDSFDLILAPEPANWLFPKMKIWAGEYYEEWCNVFENY